ncbi:MAG: hypothetical protein IPH20_03705 [Bacteroidales bacterium]|nr:hypothetical protein [Bacteroidales bacterium]
MIENILSFQKCINVKVNERAYQKRRLPDQKKWLVPFHEVLKSERACCKRIDDLKVKNQQEDCQYFIFGIITSFGNKEE